jgi:hypothetical protein
VSRDAAILTSTLRRLVARTRIVTAVEAAALGVVVAWWSPAAGLLIAIAVASFRTLRATRREIVRRLERLNSSLGNVVVTAEEIEAGTLAVRPHVADRVFRDATNALASADASILWPAWRLGALLMLAASVWLVGSTIARRDRVPGQKESGTGVATVAAPSGLTVSVTIRPPSYTHQESVTLLNPVAIRPIENSQLEFSISSDDSAVSIDLNGEKRTRAASAGEPWIQQANATRSGFALVTDARGGRRLIAITVIPDALPAVRIVSPGKDLVFDGGNPRLVFDVEATDDFGLKAVALRFTKVSGSGEQFEFSEGEIPLTLERPSAVAWKGTAARSLQDLGLGEGDMIVYLAVASDGRPAANEVTSDAYFVELSRLGLAAGDAFTLPQEETRYALSQQMLIVKTERLIASRSSLGADAFAENARGLAVEQRMIRSEFVFMLGGEIEDEEIEAEQSTELQEGRLANRGQRDLRAATVAMSQAEKYLTDANAADALKAERAAVDALQRAFTRGRYILRALATRNPLDETRRLTGTTTSAIGWRRKSREKEDDRRAIRLLGLLQALGEFAAVPQADNEERRNGLLVLAEQALRTDPESDALRQAAASLQSLADSWSALDPSARTRQFESVATAVSSLARSALADPPTAMGGTR